ncbi:transketolase C-terminal domain-containing protein [Hungatella hathewayi]|uniref:transketolase family protein n=1 Tax=Hungatella hathewayi TaxID=154046 RepID=UPI000339C4AA|nr:transketolase C-terminal domain-containing protein [Hungatella hathewayi]CCZ63020.1 transketolase subunit B [Hungatella hathewayi CAG:224]
MAEKRDPRKTFGQRVSEIAEKNTDVVILSADSGKSSGFKEFSIKYPERYFEFGIMEQTVTGIASGFATTGKIPVFCAIAPFVTCRNYEMFRNDLGYMRQNVKIVGRNGGMTYSDLGSTHHSLEDFSIIRMIPGVVVLAPQDPGEIEAAVDAMMEHDGPVYMRIGNQPVESLFEKQKFEIGKGRILRDGTDLTLISTGTITANVLKAAELLAEKGLSVMVAGMPTVWPVDEELIRSAAKKTGKIMTVEEHYTIGGLGSAVCEVCAKEGYGKVKCHGIRPEYASTGSYEELLACYKLDPYGIMETAVDFLKG